MLITATREAKEKQTRKNCPMPHPGKPTIAPVVRANQLFNIDFKGQFRTLDGLWCYPLTLTDTFSRSLLVCQAFTEPTYENTRSALERWFREFGLPEAMRSDNGTPFVASRALGGLSRLSVWAMKLGIERFRTRPGCPQDNGQHERMHRTLKEETTMPPAKNRRAQQLRFGRFQIDFNDERPHQGIGGAVPSIQKFAGALQGHRARKGVFITTSSFSKDAREFAQRIDSKIVLIDGEMLARFMVDHGVGVSLVGAYELRRVDSDYFSEE